MSNWISDKISLRSVCDPARVHRQKIFLCEALTRLSHEFQRTWSSSVMCIYIISLYIYIHTYTYIWCMIHIPSFTHGEVFPPSKSVCFWCGQVASSVKTFWATRSDPALMSRFNVRPTDGWTLETSSTTGADLSTFIWVEWNTWSWQYHRLHTHDVRQVRQTSCEHCWRDHKFHPYNNTHVFILHYILMILLVHPYRQVLQSITLFDSLVHRAGSEPSRWPRPPQHAIA